MKRKGTALAAAVIAAGAIVAGALAPGAQAWEKCPPGSRDREYCEHHEHHHHHHHHDGWYGAADIRRE